MDREKLGPLSCLVRRSTAGAPVLVALHGRGASAEDLVDLGELVLPGANHVYADAPRPWPRHAPVGLAWYDSGPARSGEIRESRAMLVDALARVRETISTGPLMLLGFSQGAVMTLDVGLREGSPAHRLVALSGYLHEETGGPDSPPVLIVNGTRDELVTVDQGRDAHARLAARDVRVTYEEYPMGHEIPPSVVRSVKAFLAGALA